MKSETLRSFTTSVEQDRVNEEDIGENRSIFGEVRYGLQVMEEVTH